jgi:hypothetical protein
MLLARVRQRIRAPGPQSHSIIWSSRTSTPFATIASGESAVAVSLLKLVQPQHLVAAALPKQKASRHQTAFFLQKSRLKLASAAKVTLAIAKLRVDLKTRNIIL